MAIARARDVDIIAVVPEPLTEEVTSEVDQADPADSGELIVVEVAPAP